MVEVVMNDTSYSDMQAPDNRGAAVSEFILNSDSTAEVHGLLEDGTAFAYQLGRGWDTSKQLVGLMERELHAPRDPSGKSLPRFVKARISSGDYMLCRVDGFKVEYSYLTEEETAVAVGMPMERASAEELSAPSMARSRWGTLRAFETYVGGGRRSSKQGSKHGVLESGTEPCEWFTPQMRASQGI